MKKLLVVLVAIAALTCLLAIPAFSADKLVVKDAVGASTFTVQDTGDIQVQNTANGIVGVRINNPDIFGASAASAQELIALGPSGSEHLILQALSDSHPSMPSTALLNAYTHNFFVRTNAQNVFKIFRAGAVGDTLVLNSGNVGIGTAIPAYKFEVCGAGGCSYNDGGLTWVNASSREYKENIHSLSADAAMNTLENLKPVTYNYKAIPEQNHVGFIAEDVPALVAMRDRKGLSALDIVAVLTKVVQEQNKTIAELSEKLNKLETQVTRIKSKDVFGSVDHSVTSGN